VAGLLSARLQPLPTDGETLDFFAILRQFVLDRRRQRRGVDDDGGLRRSYFGGR